MTTAADGPRPYATTRPAPETHTARLVLTETAGRWDLVVHADPATAEALRTSGIATGLTLTLSVQPNLVPGQPFDIASVRVHTEPAHPVETEQRST